MFAKTFLFVISTSDICICVKLNSASKEVLLVTCKEPRMSVTAALGGLSKNNRMWNNEIDA